MESRHAGDNESQCGGEARCDWFCEERHRSERRQDRAHRAAGCGEVTAQFAYRIGIADSGDQSGSYALQRDEEKHVGSSDRPASRCEGMTCDNASARADSDETMHTTRTT